MTSSTQPADNAPQESYFGHMKDELNLDTCFSFKDVCYEIKDYIEYYNNYRYQWNLKKMTPVQYRNHGCIIFSVCDLYVIHTFL